MTKTTNTTEMGARRYAAIARIRDELKALGYEWSNTDGYSDPDSLDSRTKMRTLGGFYADGILLRLRFTEQYKGASTWTSGTPTGKLRMTFGQGGATYQYPEGKKGFNFQKIIPKMVEYIEAQKVAREARKADTRRSIRTILSYCTDEQAEEILAATKKIMENPNV